MKSDSSVSPRVVKLRGALHVESQFNNLAFKYNVYARVMKICFPEELCILTYAMSGKHCTRRTRDLSHQRRYFAPDPLNRNIT